MTTRNENASAVGGWIPYRTVVVRSADADDDNDDDAGE